MPIHTYCCIHGTWGRGDMWMTLARNALTAKGHHVLPPFRWSGSTGGIWTRMPNDPADVFDDRRLVVWGAEAGHLIAHCRQYGVGDPVTFVAHSHGGQIAVLAIAQGVLRVRSLVSLATPVREDLESFYAAVPAQLDGGSWHHYHGDGWRDWMARLGQLFDGRLGWSVTMPHATNVHVPGVGHDATALMQAWLTTVPIVPEAIP